MATSRDSSRHSEGAESRHDQKSLEPPPPPCTSVRESSDSGSDGVPDSPSRDSELTRRVRDYYDLDTGPVETQPIAQINMVRTETRTTTAVPPDTSGEVAQASRAVIPFQGHSLLSGYRRQLGPRGWPDIPAPPPGFGDSGMVSSRGRREML